jgi:hypothetical protein
MSRLWFAPLLSLPFACPFDQAGVKQPEDSHVYNIIIFTFV